LGIDKEKILGIAQRYILKGQSRKAIKELQKLIEASPKDKRLHLKLGDVYLKNGDHKEAVKEYLKVAELYAEEDLNFRAISIYKKILSIDPDQIEAMHPIARLYRKEGLVGSARNYYQTILSLRADDGEALEALQTLEVQGFPEEASEILTLPPEEESFEMAPASAETRETPVMAGGEDAASPELSSDGTETAPVPPDKESEVHYHLGIAYKEMELLDFAISEFEQAASDPAIQFDCYVMLGDCFMAKGEFEKSIQYYKTASGADGLPPEKRARIHFNLGMAYEARGMVSEALNTFYVVLRMDDSFSEARERIRKLQEAEKA
jgi:pilus assembly protein FimV